MTVRKNKIIRKEELLQVAASMAVTVGYRNLIRDDVAREAQVSPGLINKYFGTIGLLKKEVIKLAVKDWIPAIIAQGMAARDPVALVAPPALKKRAIQFMAS